MDRKSRSEQTGDETAASRVVQDYLKRLLGATEWGGNSLSVSGLAQKMGVAPSTASENVRRLDKLGLITHVPYRGITLTEKGEKLALKMVRKHRILETYLHQKLGYPWDLVHAEAEELEHAASDKLIAAMERALGSPQVDPHGDPIPTSDGILPKVSMMPLGQAPLNTPVTVTRIKDSQAELLRFLESVGVVPGCQLLPLEIIPEAGIMRLKVAGKEITLGKPAVAAIWVTS